MSALFAVGQHRALVAISERLLLHEHLMVFLDDIYVVCRQERVVHIHTLMRAQLWHHALIQIHQGKTQVWNLGQMVPDNIDVLQVAARVVDLEAIVWRGSADLPTSARGVGTPLGHANFVRVYLEAKSDSHGTLLARIPAVQDLQAAWLILLFCASARANFLLRALPPQATCEFSLQHDRSLRRCLWWELRPRQTRGTWPVCRSLLEVWALEQRHPDVAGVMVRSLQGRGTGIHLDGVVGARQVLVDAGFAAPV